jgi:hypothetical protein
MHCIEFGKLTSLHLYIIYSSIFKLCQQYLIELEQCLEKQVLLNHPFILSFFQYFGFFVFGILFNCVFCVKLTINRESENNQITEDNTMNELIIEKYHLKFQLILICLVYVYFFEIDRVFDALGLHELDFWIFNILFTVLLMKTKFSIEIFKHQVYPLLVSSFINLIISLILSFLNSNENNVYDTVKGIFTTKWFSIIIILIYISRAFLISFYRLKTKFLMELKFISITRIIYVLGFFGIIITLILLSIVSSNECKGNIADYCNFNITLEENETNVKYFDSYSMFFNSLSELYNENTRDFLIEIIIIIPLYSFFHFMIVHFEFLIIFYLNPIYILITDEIYYGINYIIYYIIYKEDSIGKFFLKEISEIITGIGYLIFLEIIEIKCRGFNRYTRKQIDKRARKEYLEELDLDVREVIDIDDNYSFEINRY